MQEDVLKYITKIFTLFHREEKEYFNISNEFLEEFFKNKLSKDKSTSFYQYYIEELEKIKPTLNSSQPEVNNDFLTIYKQINEKTDYKTKIVLGATLLNFVSIYPKNLSEQLEKVKNILFDIGLLEIDIERIIFFVSLEESPKNYVDGLILITDTNFKQSAQKHLQYESIDGQCFFFSFLNENLFLFKNLGKNTLFLNGQLVKENLVYFFSIGSMLRLPKLKQIYYSDIQFLVSNDTLIQNLHFKVDSVNFSFNKNQIGMQNFSLHENQGKFIGIIGASGSGKTTLLNILSGTLKPDSGKVLVNGIDIYENPEYIRGIFGYIGQDDILLENLTVFENLFFNAKLCFGDKNEQEILEIVDKTLESLELIKIKNLEVGSVLNKKISGGQRKRLMIALELMREPHVLMVDEPTSGLSSQDSKTVVRLLKELTVRGKLIFTVIHQPSSEIYHSFDRILVLDYGGIPVFYGNPSECLNHFKAYKKGFIEYSGLDQSETNPELILETLEAKIQDEFGGETQERRLSPADWNKIYKAKVLLPKVDKYDTIPKSNLILPKPFKQWLIFCKRDLLSKWNNTSYLVINLLEAPLLALALAFILKHKNNIDNTKYTFSYNDNIPAFILISVIVALFIGLSTSVQEIIKDRKIRKRERFLNLSRNSYLFSKIAVLFLFSALQMLSFVVVSHYILEIKNVGFYYWLMLFSSACAANMLGLCVSDSFKSALSAYIVIPILLIPQLVLSGALFDYDKLNQSISAYGKTPIIADIMISRWAFEGLAVWQEKENNYSKVYYQLDKEISKINYLKNYWLPELYQIEQKDKFSEILNSEINRFKKSFGNECANCNNPEEIKHFLFERKRIFNNVKDKVTKSLSNQKVNLVEFKEKNFNEQLHLLVKHLDAEHRIVTIEGHLTQNFDAIYLEPNLEEIFNWRAPLFVAYKNFMGHALHTYIFNLFVLWIYIIALYLTLYFNLLYYIILFIESIVKKFS